MGPKRAPLTLAALAVFFASVTNAHAHIHLCFDGEQPPVTIHGADVTDHSHFGDLQHDDEPSCHDDVDLDLDADGLAKSFKPDLPAVVPQNASAVAVGALASTAPITDAGDTTGTDPPHTRPPSRAPPSILL
jgi:hypothetical protein